MTTIFNLNDGELEDKLNIDDLYEHKQKKDLETLQLFQKILARIHLRIKNTSRQKDNNQFCTYLVPEVMIGVPKYDHSECVAFIINKLRDNGFAVKYVHPNLLFIAWNHWIPSYVRTEIKKKTGIIVDGNGNVDNGNKNDTANDNKEIITENPLDNILFEKGANKNKIKEKVYKPIGSYKPTGNVVYNQDMFRKLNDKMN
jgi:hypothetical protein